MKNLTIIIPAKNEEESLPIVLDSIANLDCKVTVSVQKDDLRTIKSIKNRNVEIFYQSETGYGNSLREAITNCKTDYFCIFNADGSFNHKDLPIMFKEIKNSDFIFTSRYQKLGGSDDDTIVTYVGNKFFSKLGNILFSLNISDILYTYLIGKTDSFKKLCINSNDFRFCVELPIKIHISKMKYLSIPSHENKRIAGIKKVNAIYDGFLILIEMIKLFFIYRVFRKKIIT